MVGADYTECSHKYMLVVNLVFTLFDIGDTGLYWALLVVDTGGTQL